MQIALDIASWICLIVGSIACILGGIGINRLPEFYSRLHGAGMTDSLGAGLVLLGLTFQGGLSLVTVKLLTIWIFLYLTSPASTHALARAAYAEGVPIAALEGRDEAGEVVEKNPIRPTGTINAVPD